MRILHTADWHIGKKLYDFDLTADFDLFVSWLKELLAREKVDVLLVSGDIFDLANPSAASRSQYYQSLVDLKQAVGKIVLTGGNHDSPAMLNAPKELMRAFDLEVIGGLPDTLEETLIPLKNKQGEAEVVIAAIPFIRNSDIYFPAALKSYEERLQALRDGIAQIFETAATACERGYPGVPAIAMGHLFAAGVERSESERDIQIGNQAAVQTTAFGDYFKYVALGHIHKPQRLTAEQPVFYSGSPLPLSFSEREDKKRVLLIDTNHSWEPWSIAVPTFRKLIKISGSLDQIQHKLANLPPHEGLENLIEVELIETQYQVHLLQELQYLIDHFSKSGYQVVKHRARFENQQKQTGTLFEEEVALEELQPQNVFEELLKQEDFSVEDKTEIEIAFSELLEEITNSAE